MLLVVIACNTTAAERADHTQLKVYVKQLANDEFEVRNRAHQKLLAAGHPAWDFLKQAIIGETDPEVRIRCTELIRELELLHEQDHEKLMTRAGELLASDERADGIRYIAAAEQRMNVQQEFHVFATVMNRDKHRVELESIHSLRQSLFFPTSGVVLAGNRPLLRLTKGDGIWLIRLEIPTVLAR
jgi:hypothetical protein